MKPENAMDTKVLFRAAGLLALVAVLMGNIAFSHLRRVRMISDDRAFNSAGSTGFALRGNLYLPAGSIVTKRPDGKVSVSLPPGFLFDGVDDAGNAVFSDSQPSPEGTTLELEYVGTPRQDVLVYCTCDAGPGTCTLYTWELEGNWFECRANGACSDCVLHVEPQ